MDCQAAREMGTRLLDWDLSAGEQADLQLHLAACPDCRAELDDLFTLRQALVRLKENPLEPPSDLAAKVMSRVEAAPPLALAVGRTRAALGRRLEDITLVFKTPGRVRTAVSAAALTLVAIVAAGSLYLNHLGNPVTVAQNPPHPPVVTTVTPNPPPAKNGNTGKGSPPATTQTVTPPVNTELASASSGTMTSVWLNTDDLDAVNQQLSTAAVRYKADYHVYSLSNAPGGQNREFVRITVDPQASPAIMDQIRSSAAAVGRVVKNETSTGGQDVIIAWVNGPGQ